jgi:hypothetical protein
VTLRDRLQGYWVPVARWYGGYSPRDQRIILGVALAVGLSLVYVGPIEMIRGYRNDVREQMEDGLAQVERAQRTLRGVDALRRERDELKQRLKIARADLLPGGSGTLGAAALEARASDLAQAKGVEVRTKQVMREEAADPFRKVAVRLTLAGEIGSIAGMLAGLEYDHHFTVPFMELSRRGALMGQTGPRMLTATIEVAGFVSSGEAAAEAEAEAQDDTFVGPPWPPPADTPDAPAAAAGPEGA